MTSRNRTRSDPGRSATAYRTVNGNVANISYQMWDGSDEEMDDVVIPNFHARSRAGEIINNPMSYVKETKSTTGPGVYSATIGGSVYAVSGGGSTTTALSDFLGALGQGNAVPGLLAPNPEPTTLVDQAKAFALGQVDRSPYEFAEDLGELGETLRFLRKPFHSMRDLSFEFRKGIDRRLSREKALDRAKAIADAWTEYQFAFRPLIRSAWDLYQAFGISYKPPKRRTARGFSSWEYGNSEPWNSTYWHWERSVQIDIQYHAGLTYEVSNPVEGWRGKYGLRFRDVPETVWQLLPLSFMLDRLWNVSNTIRGLQAFLNPNVKILGGFVRQKANMTQTKSCIDYVYPTESLTMVPDTDIYTKFVYERVPWDPEWREAIAGITPDNVIDSVTKLADLGAIIAQRLR